MYKSTDYKIYTFTFWNNREFKSVLLFTVRQFKMLANTESIYYIEMFGNGCLRYRPSWQTNNFYVQAMRDLCDDNATVPSAVLNYIARTYTVGMTRERLRLVQKLMCWHWNRYASRCTFSQSTCTLTFILCLFGHDE